MHFLERLRFFKEPDEYYLLEWAIELAYLLTDTSDEEILVLSSKRLADINWSHLISWYVISSVIAMADKESGVRKLIHELQTDLAWKVAAKYCQDFSYKKVCVNKRKDYIDESFQFGKSIISITEFKYFRHLSVKKCPYLIEPVFVCNSSAYLNLKDHMDLKECRNFKMPRYLICPRWVVIEEVLAKKIFDISKKYSKADSGTFDLKKTNKNLIAHDLSEFDCVFYFDGSTGFDSSLKTWSISVELL